MNNNGENDDDDKFEQQCQKGVAKSFSEWNSKNKNNHKKNVAFFSVTLYVLLAYGNHSNNRIDTVVLSKFNR